MLIDKDFSCCYDFFMVLVEGLGEFLRRGKKETVLTRDQVLKRGIAMTDAGKGDWELAERNAEGLPPSAVQTVRARYYAAIEQGRPDEEGRQKIQARSHAAAALAEKLRLLGQ